MTVRFLCDEALAPALERAGIVDADALFALAGDAEASSVVAVVERPVAGTNGRFHYKRYRYPGWRKARGLLGRGTLFGRAPEVNEFLALEWLRRHDLPAVRPVAAASRTRLGRLEVHALLTEHVPDARNLAERLADPGDPLRRERGLRLALAEHLGATVARMHLLGFHHRDLHARNVLVRATRPRPELWLLDCRRGGPGRRKGPLFDLACLRRDLREGPTPLGTTEWMRLLGAYAGSEAGLGALDARLARVRTR